MKNCFGPLGLILAASSLSAATILVDGFKVDRHSLQITATAGVPPVGTTLNSIEAGLNPMHVLGGTRKVTPRLDFGTAGNVGTENKDGPASMNQLLLSSDPSTPASLAVEYPNINSLDLTLGGSQVGFAITMGEADHLSDYLIEVIDGATTASYAQTLDSLIPGTTFNFPFAIFSNPSALQSADSIRLSLNREPTGDYGFLKIKTYDLPDSGSSLSALGVGLFLRGSWPVVSAELTLPT